MSQISKIETDVLKIFSCEDAAQQVLMSVCVCVCVSVDSSHFTNSSHPECMQNVPDYSRMHTE